MLGLGGLVVFRVLSGVEVYSGFLLVLVYVLGV